MMSVTPGYGERDEGRVDDRDEEEAEDSEMDQGVKQCVGMGGVGCCLCCCLHEAGRVVYEGTTAENRGDGSEHIGVDAD